MIRAIHFSDEARFLKLRYAGSFMVDLWTGQRAGQTPDVFQVYCPCGCGRRSTFAATEGAGDGVIWTGRLTELSLSEPVPLARGWWRCVDGYWEAF